MPPLLSSALGDTRLLARTGDRRLCLLDAGASALWDLQAAGLAPEALAALLVERFAVAPAQARAHVMALREDWRQGGLLDADRETAGPWHLGSAQEPRWPAPRPRPLEPDAWAVSVADRRIGVHCTDAALDAPLRRRLPPAEGDGPVDHALALHGSTAHWQLELDGEIRDVGAGLDAAWVAILSTLTELGCRPAERLIVLHGAGLLAPDGQAVLLIAPGGSGKSTLAAALDAEGFGVLSDDVVPVGVDGTLYGLGLPLCLKPGSWPVLAARRPTLAHTAPTQRFGAPVRYLPAHTPQPRRAARVGALILCRYRPDHPAQCLRVGPEEALRAIIEAEAVLRDLTQTKLDALAAWIEGLPAYRLRYPDLEQARRLIDACLDPAARDRPTPPAPSTDA